MKNNKTMFVIVFCIVFIVAGFLLMFKGNLFRNKSSYEKMPEANAITGELSSNTSITQNFVCELDTIDSIALVFTKINEIDEEKTVLIVELLDGSNVLLSQEYDTDKIEDQHRTILSGGVSGLKGRELTLRISNTSNLNSGLALMMQDNDYNYFSYNQSRINGTICFNISGK